MKSLPIASALHPGRTVSRRKQGPSRPSAPRSPAHSARADDDLRAAISHPARKPAARNPKYAKNSMLFHQYTISLPVSMALLGSCALCCLSTPGRSKHVGPGGPARRGSAAPVCPTLLMLASILTLFVVPEREPTGVRQGSRRPVRADTAARGHRNAPHGPRGSERRRAGPGLRRRANRHRRSKRIRRSRDRL